MKKEYIVLLAILVVAFAYRAYNYRLEYFTDNDAFLHISVIRQAMLNGNLKTFELSYANPPILEPLGLYYVTLAPAYFIGLESAFLLMPLLFGVACVLISYFLFKDLFNSRVALIACLILALSLAHAYRTSPNTYRGDGFYLTFFVLILYLFNKSLKGTWKDSFFTGLALGFSASIWNGYPLGVLVIISGLIINSTFKFLRNEFSKKDLIKNAALLITYYIIESILVLTGVVKDFFFTINKGIHLVIVFVPLIISLVYLFTHKVRKSKVVSVIVISGIIVFILNFNLIQGLISQGLFENSLFYSIGVSELLPPTQDLFFTMFSWTFYLFLPGLIILVLLVFTKKKPEHLTFLVWVLVSVYLMLNYSRYTFIASITLAGLTALILDYAYTLLSKNKKLVNPKIFGLLILALFFVPYVFDSVNGINKMGSRINSYWVEALTYLKTQPAGNVVSWWDHGSWVQYYSSFPSVVDSVTGQDEVRIQRIAKFLMTSEPDYFIDYNASYLILGIDDMLYSGAIAGIAGVTSFEAGYVGQVTKATRGTETVYVYPSGSGYFELFNDGVLYLEGNNQFVVNKTFFNNKSGSLTLYSNYSQTKGCLSINPTLNIFVNDYGCKSNYVNLMYGSGIPGYELIYRNDYVVIYKIVF